MGQYQQWRTLGAKARVVGGGGNGDGGRIVVVQQHNVPEAILSRCGMARPDYVDLFTVTAPRAEDSSAEQWARAGLERAAGAGGQFVWRVLLGLRLQSEPSPQHVAGWRIADRGDGWLRVEASSWCLTAHIVIQVDEDEVSVATTLIRYDRPPAAALWPPLSIGHRRAMPGLLRHAVRIQGAVT